MAKLMDVLPAGQRMTKSPHAVIPILLRLLVGGRNGSGDALSSESVPWLPVSVAALACLARIAGCNDSERSNALRDALTGDDQAWDSAAPTLLSALAARPPRMRLAANAALVLWVAVGDDASKREKLIIKQKVSCFPHLCNLCFP